MNRNVHVGAVPFIISLICIIGVPVVVRADAIVSQYDASFVEDQGHKVSWVQQFSFPAQSFTVSEPVTVKSIAVGLQSADPCLVPFMLRSASSYGSPAIGTEYSGRPIPGGCAYTYAGGVPLEPGTYYLVLSDNNLLPAWVMTGTQSGPVTAGHGSGFWENAIGFVPNTDDGYHMHSWAFAVCVTDDCMLALPLTVTATDQTMTIGAPIPRLTAALDGLAANVPNDVTGEANCSTTATASSPVGTYPITCTVGTLSSKNYVFKTFVAGTLTIRYRWDGFLPPINDPLRRSGDASVFKANQTVPVKLQLKRDDGTVVQSASVPQWLVPQKGNPLSQSVIGSAFTPVAGVSDVFAAQTDHYQYNWNTKGLQGGYWYKLSATLDDGTTQSVIVGLK